MLHEKHTQSNGNPDVFSLSQLLGLKLTTDMDEQLNIVVSVRPETIFGHFPKFFLQIHGRTISCLMPPLIGIYCMHEQSTAHPLPPTNLKHISTNLKLIFDACFKMVKKLHLCNNSAIVEKCPHMPKPRVKRIEKTRT